MIKCSIIWSWEIEVSSLFYSIAIPPWVCIVRVLSRQVSWIVLHRILDSFICIVNYRNKHESFEYMSVWICSVSVHVFIREWIAFNDIICFVLDVKPNQFLGNIQWIHTIACLNVLAGCCLKVNTSCIPGDFCQMISFNHCFAARILRAGRHGVTIATCIQQIIL